MTCVLYWSYNHLNFIEHLNTLSKEQVENARIKFPTRGHGSYEILYWKD